MLLLALFGLPMWLLCQLSPKNWVFGFFRLGLTLESGFGACWDRGLGTLTRAWQLQLPPSAPQPFAYEYGGADKDGRHFAKTESNEEDGVDWGVQGGAAWWKGADRLLQSWPSVGVSSRCQVSLKKCSFDSDTFRLIMVVKVWGRGKTWTGIQWGLSAKEAIRPRQQL